MRAKEREKPDRRTCAFNCTSKGMTTRIKTIVVLLHSDSRCSSSHLLKHDLRGCKTIMSFILAYIPVEIHSVRLLGWYAANTTRASDKYEGRDESITTRFEEASGFILAVQLNLVSKARNFFFHPDLSTWG